jgi:hypothetical protein
MAGFSKSPLARQREYLIHTARGERKPVLGTLATDEVPFKGRQKTVSEGHRWPPREGESFHDRGGPFFTQHNYYEKIHGINLKGYGGRGISSAYDYVSMTGAVPGLVYSPSGFLPETSSTELTAEGTKALNQMRPTAPLSGLGTTLGELKDGLPSVIGSGMLKALMRDFKDARRLLKEGSKEYLNWEFGWKPLVNDLRDAARAVSDSERIINQLYRDSGRDVRRRFGYPVTRETAVQSYSSRYATPLGSTQLWDAPGTLYTTTTTSRYVWVSGMCRYYVPESNDLRSRIQRQAMVANRLLGLRPDPELLWELAPWSWLVDWVGSVGSLMGNLSSFAFDGLVWKYAYLMEHQKEEYDTALVGHRMFDGSSPRCTMTRIRESKRRVTSTPFGFGLDLDSFSLRQWSILAALGISRGNL